MDLFNAHDTPYALFDAFPEPIFFTSGLRALYFNDSARRLFREEELTPGGPLPACLSALIPPGEARFTRTGCVIDGRCFSVTGTEQTDGLLLVLRPEERQSLLSDPFLGALSDRLRTPLNALLAAASLLAPAAEGSPQYETYLSVINQYHYRLLRIVGDLGAVSRLVHAGSDAAQDAAEAPRNTDIVPLLLRLCQAADDLARVTGRRIVFESDRDQLILAAEPELLSRLLFHLISNALKFSPEEAAISVRLTRKDNRALLSVVDQGPGFDKGELASAFSSYASDTVPDARPKGLGFGLALVRQIAERHGGSVLLESRPGGGTTVTVALPIRRLEDETLHTYRPPADLYGGFNPALVSLSDALPPEAFRPRDLE